jgi:NADH-quinone oxidoreductase subunit K
MIPIGMVLGFSAVLFCIGAVGVMVRRNALFLLMSIELMLNAANLALVGFSRHVGNLNGQVLVMLVMAIAAAEAAVGLALVVTLFRNFKTVFVDEIFRLKG